MDRLHTMRVFAKVVDEGSFAAAARALDLSPAVVTRLVADLEAHLGARLIQRTTRRMALTPTGEEYLERVRQILADIDEAEMLAKGEATEVRGHLRVLAPPSFASHQLAKHLARFRAQYPRVTIELTVPGPVESVDEAHDVTLLLVGRKPLEGDFIARRLARAEVITCASPDYLARRGRPVHPSELAGHDALLPPASAVTGGIVFRRRNAPDDAAVQETFEVPQRRSALTTVHLDTMYAAALAGMGIAGLPSFVVEDALRHGRLERVLPEWHVLTATLYAAMPTRKHVPARTRAFVDFLVQTFGGEDRDPWQDAATRPAGASAGQKV